MHKLQFILIVGCFIINLKALSEFRGINPENLHLYKSVDVFTCFDGKKSISISRVNDDYCDCEDGSDEPGTAACPNGRFFCQNSGHISAYIPASKVNDGVCEPECCDGSDEYSSAAQCPDTCEEAGRKHRAEMEKLQNIKKKGMEIKAEYSEFGRKLKESRNKRLQTSKKRLEQVKNDLKPLLESQHALQEQISLNEKNSTGDSSGACCDKLSQTNTALLNLKQSLENFQSKIEDLRGSQDQENQAEELNPQVQELLSAWESVDVSALQTLSVPEDEIDEYDAAGPEVNSEEDKKQDGIVGGLATYFQSVSKPIYNFASNIVFKTGVVSRSELDSMKTELSSLNEKISKLQNEERELEAEVSKLEQDIAKYYGPDEVFSKLDGDCFNYHADEYNYEMCPFGEAKQKNAKSGAVIAKLGSWNAWTEESNFMEMNFSGGDGCWNGPARSLHVRLACGTENKLTSVSEPQKCEYLMEMETPAACSFD